MKTKLSVSSRPPRLPLGLKLGYTAFMAVLVPVYWLNYGPANFLYFCDTALFLTGFALWSENALAASMAAVGILVPQFLWCLDFGVHLAGFKLTGMTDYMFEPNPSTGWLRAATSRSG
jgi:hypothetical protein